MFCVLFQMNLLLKEYLTSGDVLEAEHCLRDLEVPHFHHELVYEVKQRNVRCTVQNKFFSNVIRPYYIRSSPCSLRIKKGKCFPLFFFTVLKKAMLSFNKMSTLPSTGGKC